MDARFSLHNTHLLNAKDFHLLDPQLRSLARVPYPYRSPLLKEFPHDIPGIYILGGGRQIGKTTLLKQWMAELLARDVPPQAIGFFTGELINDQQALVHLLQFQVANMPRDQCGYLIIDEVTSIKQWEQGIKFAADAGLFENITLMLSGSDLALLSAARMTFPGRRGKASKVDFHYYPLSFAEFLGLKHGKNFISYILEMNEKISRTKTIDQLFTEFEQYLMHGGYLTAINELASEHRILPATLMIYSDWIRGDMLKRNKQEHYLKEILQSMIKHYGTQISWNNLAEGLSIDHHKTVADYVFLLENFDAVFVQHALLEDKLVAAPKKNKKLLFSDPFIYHAITHWIYPITDPFEQQIKTTLLNSDRCANLVEACVTTHFRRHYPTYYIKAEGEVDIAFVAKQKFHPIEIKWTTQLRSKNLKQIKKYKNGKIWARTREFGSIEGISVTPLVIGLLRLG